MRKHTPDGPREIPNSYQQPTDVVNISTEVRHTSRVGGFSCLKVQFSEVYILGPSLHGHTPLNLRNACSFLLGQPLFLVPDRKPAGTPSGHDLAVTRAGFLLTSVYFQKPLITPDPKRGTFMLWCHVSNKDVETGCSCAAARSASLAAYLLLVILGRC